MKYTSIVLIIFLSLINNLSKGFASDSTEVVKEKLHILIENRKARFGNYLESLDEKTGFFGNQTKKDVKRSNEVLETIALDLARRVRRTAAVLRAARRRELVAFRTALRSDLSQLTQESHTMNTSSLQNQTSPAVALAALLDHRCLLGAGRPSSGRMRAARGGRPDRQGLRADRQGHAQRVRCHRGAVLGGNSRRCAEPADAVVQRGRPGPGAD